MDIHTHHLIDQELCGQPVDLQPGYCRVSFRATDRMAADDKGLVHGGFVFGLADYAAMLAVNHPHVVLGAAEVRFLKPVRIGAILSAVAEVATKDGKKHTVTVVVSEGDQAIFQGTFTCFILTRHALDG